MLMQTFLYHFSPNHHPTADYVARLREQLPREFTGMSFFFEPADIVAQTLNFGVPAPIDIQFVGQDVSDNFKIAAQVAQKMRSVPGAVDVHIQQAVDQPRLQYDVDRVRIQQLGLTERDVANNVLISLSSSFQTTPNFWLNPKNGVSYNIAVQTPQYKINSVDALNNIPVNSPTAASPQLFENLASMTRVSEPAVVSHYNVRPVIDIYAERSGPRSGRRRKRRAANYCRSAAKSLPRGSTLVTRGQVATMRSSFVGLFAGLGFAIALVYLLLVVNFQSWTEAFIIITALPGAWPVSAGFFFSRELP